MQGRDRVDNKWKVSLLLDFYGPLLSAKQREIMDCYYNNDLSLREIADNIGITRQGVHDTVKRTEAALFEMEEQLGLYNRFAQVEQGLDHIDCLAKEIQQNSLTAKGDNVLAEKTEEIRKTIERLKTIN